MTTAFTLINISLLAILVATALAIARIRALYEATMLTALFSLVTACLFVLLDSVDVAFTEAAVGVGISTILMFGVLALTGSREAVTPRRRRWPGGLVVLLTGGLLMYVSQDLPSFGSADSPVQIHPVTQKYLYESQEEIGIPNTVTSVLAGYRSLDTLGELVVVFTAGIAVALLLGGKVRRPHSDDQGPIAEYRVLRVLSTILLPFILLFAFYVLFHGDYGPGGGFQAGVIFASGFVLYGLVFGLDGARRVLPESALGFLAPVGLLIFVGLGVFNILAGNNFLDHGSLIPGDSKAGQHMGILIVETAIGVTVAAVMTAVFYSFAGRSTVRSAAR